MLFGVKAALGPQLYEDMVRTGTLHIVALSGMNITILMTLTDLLFLKFVSKRISSLLTIVFIMLFILFVGPSASVIRAAIMGTITLMAVIFGRQVWAIWSWVVAASIMLLLNPGYAQDVSFQLSVMATLGIIFFGRDSGHVGWAKENLRVTFAAQVFTIPIILLTFHRISFIAPVSNLLIGWVVSPVTAIGLAMTFLAALWLPLGQLLAWVVWVPLQFMLVVITTLSHLPFASIGG
jgi:competence protein ComEC